MMNHFRIFVMIHNPLPVQDLEGVFTKALALVVHRENFRFDGTLYFGSADFSAPDFLTVQHKFSDGTRNEYGTLDEITNHATKNKQAFLILLHGADPHHATAYQSSYDNFFALTGNYHELNDVVRVAAHRLNELSIQVENEIFEKRNPRIAGLSINDFCCRDMYVFYTRLLKHGPLATGDGELSDSVSLNLYDEESDYIQFGNGFGDIPNLNLKFCPECGKPPRKKPVKSLIDANPHV